MTMREKQIFVKGYWNPKRKLGVTTLFFRDNFKATTILKTRKIQSNVWRFFHFEALLSLKMHGYRQFFFFFFFGGGGGGLPRALA